jgi:hypothetical protein
VKSLITPDGQRQPEGQNEPDDAEQCGLQDRQRLAQAVRPVALGPTQQQAQSGCTKDNGEQDEPESPAAELEEQRRLLS